MGPKNTHFDNYHVKISASLPDEFVCPDLYSIRISGASEKQCSRQFPRGEMGKISESECPGLCSFSARHNIYIYISLSLSLCLFPPVFFVFPSP